MTELKSFRVLPRSVRRYVAFRWVKTLACALALTVPSMVLAQSAELLRAYQNFETAKAANKVPEALKYGNEAVKLTEDGGDKPSVIELLRNLGDFAAQAGEDRPAAEYYTRALSAQESVLGRDHPDLVPVLTALADLKLKDKRYAEAAALEQRILDIERQSYGEHHENVLATLNKLRDIYRAGGDAAGATRIDGEVRAWSPPPALPPPPPAGERGLPGIPGGIAGTDRRYRQNQQGFATVRVFYGTNRAPTGDVKPALFYGKERGELQYGYLNVTIPRLHKEAELETQPRWAEYTFVMSEASMRRQYVLLDQITPLAKDDFTRALRQQIKDSSSKDLFIFVHGFNNTFEDAARRAAQMAYDLDFDGTPILYSWPSQGSVVAYAADEAAVGISGRKMADFLETVVAQSGAQRIHVLAHSMGNRALIEAMQTYLAKRAPDKRQHIFGQIVFTAPDVDRDYFIDAIDSLRGSAERVTLYASGNDRALHYSQFVHGAPRAGTAGDVIVKLAGLDTIDMSAVPADILGHSYFAANSGAINDIFRIFWRGDAPPQRCGMKDRKGGGTTLTVWWFNADACMGDDVLEAGVMLKRFGDLARDQVAANISALTDPSQKREWQLILNRLNGLLTTAAAAPAGTAAAPGGTAK
ncbi:MAG TPA: alpha/beta hydrolase [Steroidobacteraceae bacterium]